MRNSESTTLGKKFAERNEYFSFDSIKGSVLDSQTISTEIISATHSYILKLVYSFTK